MDTLDGFNIKEKVLLATSKKLPGYGLCPCFPTYISEYSGPKRPGQAADSLLLSVTAMIWAGGKNYNSWLSHEFPLTFIVTVFK